MATPHLPDLHRGGRLGEKGHDGLRRVRTALWAVIGALVVLYILFATLDAIDPGEARGLTIAILVLAALWLAHAWRRLWADEGEDRGRRG
jgi:hypothetical protein